MPPSEDPAPGLPARPPVGPLLVLFGLSGFSALVYETVWMRPLKVLFGATHEATSLVLSAFMLGMGAGAFWAGRRADRDAARYGADSAARRALLAYAALEAIVGLFAFLFPVLLRGAEALYLELYPRTGSAALAQGLRALFVGGLLIVPTFAMGATLPFALRAATGRAQGEGQGLSLIHI